jgi:hypothetical protein
MFASVIVFFHLPVYPVLKAILPTPINFQELLIQLTLLADELLSIVFKFIHANVHFASPV